MKTAKYPVRKRNCKTCPWLEGQAEEWACLKPMLMDRALHSTPLCHSTGKALTRHNGERLKAHVCRGARDFQLELWYRMGFLSAPTDEAWDAKLQEIEEEEHGRTDDQR